MELIENWVSNQLAEEPSGVYRLVGHDFFAYSDGADSEKYLNTVFDSCNDLGSGSTELLDWIKDWPSEYHLSDKRANLLNAFSYEPSSNVLEVGCGCGAISRFLGETFENVVSIEGSLARAEIARKRCRDLSNVHILSAPFQEIEFKNKFDIIFCIGVLEYSNKFVKGDDPYNSIIQYFSRHLTSDGVLVVAIENRFGLKYFNSASEDHTGRRFDGIEDYPGSASKAKTFGYSEIREMLDKEFETTEFFFPFPDYKIPDAVFSEDLFAEADISGMLAKFPSRDYSRPFKPLFSEERAWASVSRNSLVHVFSNSFLAVARKGGKRFLAFDGLGMISNTDRVPMFQTRSRIYRDEDTDELRISKRATSPNQAHEFLELRNYDDRWRYGESLLDSIVGRALVAENSLEDIFSPAVKWYEYISKVPRTIGADGVDELSSYFDAIWQNTIIEDGEVFLIDQEWAVRERIVPRHILIRAIYTFLIVVRRQRRIARDLRYRSGAALMMRIAPIFDEVISKEDLNWFIKTESSVYAGVTGNKRFYHEVGIRLTLIFNHTSARVLTRVRNAGQYFVFGLRLVPRIWSRIIAILKNRFTKQ